MLPQDAPLARLGETRLMDLFALIFAVLAIAFVWSAVTVVRQGFEYTLERFGRFTMVLRSGFNLILPFIDRVGRQINMMEQVLYTPGREIITRDNAMISTDGVAFFQVLGAAKIGTASCRERVSQYWYISGVSI